MAVVVGAASFPQKGNNRTRAKAVEEIADHTGGADRPEIQRKAADCLDASVREFNSIRWKFNRMRDSITLAANTADYELETDFDGPLVALLLDASGNIVAEVPYISYPLWSENYTPQTHTGGIPIRYTVRNVHETGIVTIDPKMGTTITYPTLRIDYFRRILIASGDDDRLNVPMEVDEAIFQLGLAKFLSKMKEAARARDEYRLAGLLRMEVERKHRDYGKVM